MYEKPDYIASSTILVGYYPIFCHSTICRLHSIAHPLAGFKIIQVRFLRSPPKKWSRSDKRFLQYLLKGETVSYFKDFVSASGKKIIFNEELWRWWFITNIMKLNETPKSVYRFGDSVLRRSLRLIAVFVHRLFSSITSANDTSFYRIILCLEQVYFYALVFWWVILRWRFRLKVP